MVRSTVAGILIIGIAGCGKKGDQAEKEIREAGYEMTSGGWFGAVRADDVEVMRKMVEGGFDLKTKDGNGSGALHVAAAAGATGAAEYLLNKGIAVDGRNNRSATPLMEAVEANQPEMVKWLLRQGADPKAKDGEDFMPLMRAVADGKGAVVEELAPYHREDLDSALLLAALVGKVDVIDVLTNYGASVYARMEDGRTPLMLAAQNGHGEAAALLMDLGASRFATTEDGETARSFAVSAGHADIAQLIATGNPDSPLAFESDEKVVEALDGEEFAGDPPRGGVDDSVMIGNPGGAGDGDIGAGGRKEVAGGADVAGGFSSGARDNPNSPEPGIAASSRAEKGGIRMLEGARIGSLTEINAGGGKAGAGRSGPRAIDRDLPLVMRFYKERELPVEVRKVSGETAILRMSGRDDNEIEVVAGERISESDLHVVRVYSKMEQGKLNESRRVEVGIVEVEDRTTGKMREWVVGKSAGAHEPVALVVDAATGMRYLAKPGQTFRSEDGREFVVSDVRPGQIVIEDRASGETRTLPLRGPKG